MTRSEREELRRAIMRLYELTQPHKLLQLIELADKADVKSAQDRSVFSNGHEFKALDDETVVRQ